ncbi:MAG: diaminopimelate decarboxylase [Ignavibacteriae bacterium]|nr:MAG: diaminopimelate decarboxylase [Ignavibacteriota bacterium]
MKYIAYKENTLLCEDVPLSELAEEYGTPLYVYSKNQIIEQYRYFNNALGDPRHRVCYALKANANHHILKLLANEGAGADVVSAGELFLALKAGFSPAVTVFAGVGKREDEIEYALKQNIFSFNVESVSELHTISRVALRCGTKARISLRINPDIDAQSHPYITTGLLSTKFGIEASKALEVYAYAATLSSLELVGVHTHIGSQITRVEPFIATANYITGLVGKLRETGIHLSHIDFGGGFGVQYVNAVEHEAIKQEENPNSTVPTPAEFLGAVLPILQTTGCAVWIEPGRSLIADAGVLITRVISVKENTNKKFVIVDAGMNDLIRPSLYQAYHQIVPLSISTYESEKVDVVGPICENTDFFARERMLSKTNAGDCLAIMTTGAYGFVLSSNYNGRLRPAEILVNGDRVRIIRPRQLMGELE